MKRLQSITGMNDMLSKDRKYWHKLESVTKKLFERYGYEEIRTPILESTNLFQRGIGENTQVVKKEMYTFDDKGQDSVTMRPEGTAPVVRSLLQHKLLANEELLKLYYNGPMFRYERPQKGRLRQFHQIGVEVFGIDSPLLDAEIVILLDRVVKELGIEDYKIKVNTLGLVSERKPYIQKLQSYFEPVKSDLCEDCQARLQKNTLRIFDCKVPKCQSFFAKAPVLMDSLSEETKKHYEDFKLELQLADVDFEEDQRIVRGLDYYEKTTFEFVSDKLGSQSAFAGGGRYNKLIEDLGGKPMPATGFAMGCERLILLMQEFEKKSDEVVYEKAIYLAPLNDDAFGKAKKIKQDLLDQEIKAEMSYSLKSLKSNMRKAGKKQFRYVGLLGEDELAKNKILIKDMADGEQKEMSWDEIQNLF